MPNADEENQKLLQNNESGINKWLLFDISTIVFFATICSSVPLPFFTRNYIKRGGSYMLAGVIMQIYPVSVGCTAWLFGKLIPRFGYKKIVLFGLILEGMAQIGFATATYIQPITTYTTVTITMRILSGTGNAAALTTALAIAVTDFEKHSTFVLSLLECATGVSYLLGPLVITGIYKYINSMFLPLLIPGVLCFLSPIRFAIYYKPHNHQRSFNNVKFSTTLKIMFDKTLIGPIFLQMCVLGTFGYIAVYLTVYIAEIGLTVLDSGILVSLSVISWYTGTFLFCKIIPRYHKYMLIFMVSGLAGWATDMLCLTVNNRKFTWIVYAGYSIRGIFDSAVVVSVFQFSLDYLQNMESLITFNERVSCLAGIWASSINIGKFLFTTIGGLVIESTGSIVKSNMGFVIFGYVLTSMVLIIVIFHFLKNRKCH